MNLVRCDKGHFYDKDKFGTCPHCQPGDDAREVTVALQEDAYADSKQGSTEMDMPEASSVTMSLKDAVNMANKGGASIDDDDDDMGKTIRYYDTTIGTEPVVGWLIGLTGDVFGQSFVLKAGRNFIGRGQDMDVVLTGDDSVSRNKHAIVVYEPKARLFIAQPGESRELFYVNDKVVLNNEQIRKNDILLLGKTKLMLIPCCDENFCWEEMENER